MAVVTEAFDIPLDIMTKLATGEYRRIGGVVRVAMGPNKGQIVKHLKPVKLEQAAQAQNVGAKVLQFAKNNKKGLIIGTVVAGTITAGGVVYHKIKNREPSGEEISCSITRLHQRYSKWRIEYEVHQPSDGCIG